MRLVSYGPISIPMPKKDVDEIQLSARVNDIISQIPYYADGISGTVDREDRVKIHITLAENGKPLKGLNDAELTITVGDGFFPEPFYEGIIGMKPEEFRLFAWQDSSGEEDGPREMSAAVRVLSVHKREKPPMDDAWVAAHIPRCSTLEEFFQQVRRQLQEESDKKWQTLLSERCKAALAQRLETLPSAAEFERAIAGVQKDFDRMMASEGKVKSQVAAEQGIDEDQLDILLTQQGVMTATESLALKAVAEHFDLQVTDEDITASLEANFSADDPMRKYFETDQGRTDLAEIALQEKALHFALRHLVQITDESSTPSSRMGSKLYPNPFQ